MENKNICVSKILPYKYRKQFVWFKVRNVLSEGKMNDCGRKWANCDAVTKNGMNPNIFSIQFLCHIGKQSYLDYKSNYR
jgi:hypothetical protein